MGIDRRSKSSWVKMDGVKLWRYEIMFGFQQRQMLQCSKGHMQICGWMMKQASPVINQCSSSIQIEYYFHTCKNQGRPADAACATHWSLRPGLWGDWSGSKWLASLFLNGSPWAQVRVILEVSAGSASSGCSLSTAYHPAQPPPPASD